MIAFLTSTVFLTSVLPGLASGLLVNALRVSGHPAAQIAARLVPQLVERLRSPAAESPDDQPAPSTPRKASRRAQ